MGETKKRGTEGTQGRRREYCETKRGGREGIQTHGGGGSQGGGREGIQTHGGGSPQGVKREAVETTGGGSPRGREGIPSLPPLFVSQYSLLLPCVPSVPLFFPC